MAVNTKNSASNSRRKSSVAKSSAGDAGKPSNRAKPGISGTTTETEASTVAPSTEAKTGRQRRIKPSSETPGDSDHATGDTSVSASVESLLKTLTLNEAGQTNAAIARALAAKLDEARWDTSATIAMAIGSIAKELRSVVDAILASTGDEEQFVAKLFELPSAMGNTQDA